MRTQLQLFAIAVILFLAGCTPLTLKPVNFTWPVEEPVTPDANGNVHVKRYMVTFNVKALLFDAVQDSVNMTKHELRLIRDVNGYYFITAKKFKEVYVFGTGDGTLELKKKILVNEKGLEAPAFNQNKENKNVIMLINENKDGEAAIQLTKDGILEGGKK